MFSPLNVPQLYFQNNFFMSKTSVFFIKEFQFGGPFFGKVVFLNFNFQTFYFLKLCPIFVDSALGLFTKYILQFP